MPRGGLVKEVAIGAPALALTVGLLYAMIALGAGDILLLALYVALSVIGFGALSYIVGGFVVDMIESGQRGRKGADA
jgi:hypothetical protein